MKPSQQVQKYIFVTLILWISVIGLNLLQAQQMIQLYTEDFNTGGGSFTLNTTGPAANNGINQFVVNNQFNGGVNYPVTTPQTNTTSGTIGGAPFSQYLHIHDQAYAGTAANANYNSNVASDRFAAMNQGFCTLGLEQVTLTFFYLAEGNATDFGELYYSLNGGASWISTGYQFSNTNLWTYQIVTNPAFDNQQDVRFGFRWKNSANGSAPSMSLAIDDIIVVGTYDNINSPVTISVTNVAPNPVCQGAFLSIQYSLSAPLCAGTYAIEMSNSAGNFAPAQNMGVFNIGPNTTTGGISIVIPTTTAPGNCYRVRISRLSPAPAITGIASVCFVVQACPNTITTLQPAVTLGPDTLCVNSVIDVPFYSTGAFLANNQYIAQLSDANGSFATPQTIGSIPDPNTYDPTLGSPPGNVSGVVPVTPPGCNYYIRVISTSPSVIPPPPSYFGPFCIRQCDIETNNIVDITMCITAAVGADSTVQINVNSWNNTTTYCPTNQFQIQVINSQTYQVLNTGGLGTVSLSGNGSMTLSVPGLSQLIPIIGPPGTGMFYVRVVATCPSDTNQVLGTLIRLTIGAPDSIPPTIFPSDSAICPGDILSLFYSPQKPGSTYQWWSPSLQNGNPFFWAFNPLMVQFNPNAPPSTHYFSVRENSMGCWGPWADTVSVNVLGVPNVNITGPTPVCAGDTVQFQVPFMDNTYYQWNITFGNIIDTANNVITVVFPGGGAGTVSVFALNKCGSANGTYNFNVLTKPNVTAYSDTTLCVNVPVTLSAQSNALTYDWFAGANQVGSGQNIVVTPQVTTTYTVVVTDANGCKQRDSVVVSLFDLPVPDYVLTEEKCFGDDTGSATVTVTGGLPPFLYAWATPPPQTGTTASNLPQGTYQLSITDNLGCIFLDTIEIVGPDTFDAQIVPNHVTCFGYSNGYALGSPTGGTLPYTYLWSQGATQALAQGLPAGTYNLTVTDSNNCLATNTVVINQPPQLTTTVAEKQVSCFNGSDGVATSIAQGGTPGYLYEWSSNPSQQAASAYNLSAGTYQVTVTDGNGCEVDGFITVTQPDSMSWDLQLKNPTCYGYSDGWAVVTLSGGIPAYQVNWGIQKSPNSWMATGLNAGQHLLPIMDSRNCLDTVPVILDQPNPLPSPTVFDDTICAGDEAALKGIVTGDGNSVCWSLTTADTFPIFCGGTYLTSPLFSTRYYFAQTVDLKGCKGAMIPVLVTVLPTPQIEFEANRLYNELPNAIFSFYPTDSFPEIVEWLWELGDNNTSELRDPVHQYSETGYYTVKVTAIDTNGCKDVVEKLRYVEVGRTVFLVAPNAFSPNGDGVNDYFSISHRYIHSFTVKIFDRWGNLIYTSDNPNFRWDGSLNGQPLPESAYVFTVFGVAADGTPVELSGSVTLIR